MRPKDKKLPENLMSEKLRTKVSELPGVQPEILPRSLRKKSRIELMIRKNSEPFSPQVKQEGFPGFSRKQADGGANHGR